MAAAFDPAQWFAAAASELTPNKALPVDSWNPPFCGDIDMHIGRDGRWFYNGTPILRPAMVELFARILRREGDRYFLVTPVEKVGITVEDAPFIAVAMEVSAQGTPDQILTFRTQVGDIVTADEAHPLLFRTSGDPFVPYIEVRRGLQARLSRNLAQDVAALGEIHPRDGQDWFGVWSSGLFFAAAPAEGLI